MISHIIDKIRGPLITTDEMRLDNIFSDLESRLALAKHLRLEGNVRLHKKTRAR